ncbi:MAG: VOC family protein [Planctomycetota bacterium]|jgi:predicted enzyme related to lactoylglutathione lyase
MIKAKYKHTNIVAQDWRGLADFYCHVLGCTEVPPERAGTGEWVERCTSVPGAEIRGIHLKLPGYGEDGPTLEIFQYNNAQSRPETAINRPGLAHLAFEVEDVEAARDELTAAGGACVGEMVTVDIPDAGIIRKHYRVAKVGIILIITDISF